jgi:uncharacterized protein (TIGR00296 family)
MDNSSTINIKKLCAFCFDVLLAKLDKKDLPVIPEIYKDLKFPLFVTWTVGKEEDLRGCIGTFSEESLGKNLGTYALTSALKDSRFSPITLKEVPTLNVGVSLLTNFEKANDYLDWEVGKHGIEIDFEVSGNAYRGTYLPEVASEQQWDNITTMKSLVRKGGK